MSTKSETTGGPVTERQFTTGSVRDNRDGKGRCDLLPTDALLEVAKAFERGAKKYAERNWEKGQPMSVYADSGMRHLFQWAAGRKNEDHLVSACVNLLMAIATRGWIHSGVLPRELMDDYRYDFNEEAGDGSDDS